MYPRQPYWQGQQARHTHISAHKPNSDINKEEYDEIDNTKYNHSHNNSRGRGRGLPPDVVIVSTDVQIQQIL